MESIFGCLHRKIDLFQVFFLSFSYGKRQWGIRGEPGLFSVEEEGSSEEAKVLLPPAAKRVEFINFSGTKRSFGRRDSANCKQCGTK